MVQFREVLRNQERPRTMSICNLDNPLRLIVLTPPPPLTHTDTLSNYVNTLCLRIGYPGSKEVKYTFMVTGEIEGLFSIRHIYIMYIIWQSSDTFDPHTNTASIALDRIVLISNYTP